MAHRQYLVAAARVAGEVFLPETVSPGAEFRRRPDFPLSPVVGDFAG
ncbi:hypothetical protein WAB17_12425 [Parerythrobacter aurantius]